MLKLNPHRIYFCQQCGAVAHVRCIVIACPFGHGDPVELPATEAARQTKAFHASLRKSTNQPRPPDHA
jgi:hypothetical protein